MVYLDYNASTPLDPRVSSALQQWLAKHYANPSSTHAAGQASRELIEGGRLQIAQLAGVRPRDVLFTSGASEAAAISLLGLGTTAARGSARDVIIGATEHKAIRAAAEVAVGMSGGLLREVAVDPDGVLDLRDLTHALAETTPFAVVVMHANNETGVLSPLREVRELVPDQVPLVVDLTQSAGKIPLGQVPFDIGFFSSHKIYGPKGVGALLAPREWQRRMTPIFPGGGQERGLRGGTVPAPLVGAFGLAAEIAQNQLSDSVSHSQQLLQALTESLRQSGLAFSINGAGASRIPNTLNIRIVGVDAEAVMVNAPDLLVSDGSACTSAQPLPSHVLLAMGLDRRAASECLRISVGRPTTLEDIATAVELIVNSAQTVLNLDDGIPA